MKLMDLIKRLSGVSEEGTTEQKVLYKPMFAFLGCPLVIGYLINTQLCEKYCLAYRIHSSYLTFTYNILSFSLTKYNFDLISSGRDYSIKIRH